MDGISTPPAEEATDERVVSPNAEAKKNSTLLWASIIGVAAVLGGFAVYSTVFPPDPKPKQKLTKEEAVRIKGTASVASGVPISPTAENAQLKSERSDMDARLRQLEAENAALSAERDTLNSRNLQDREEAYQMLQAERDRRGGSDPHPTRGYPAETADGAGFSPTPNPAPSLQTDAAGTARPRRSFKTVSLNTTSSEGTENGAQPAVLKGSAVTDRIETFDPSEYVPPNSYATARVLVGVDMQTGVSGNSDPKPVLLRIRSQAFGVGMDGKFQSSDLRGCTINGAAYAELSSEKVYVKLQRITCEGKNGKFLTSPVEGYVTYKGKTGVRGKVVRREGDYASKAFIAGTFRGLGQAMEKNVQGTISGRFGESDAGSIINARPLSSSEIGQASVGSGVSNAGGMLADYYIKRAEQYQPVIEMPTGIDVEIVFLSGFRFKETSKK
ncbi:TrbI/VirB10 family protein [Asticcacaulis sp. BYS171W]|uniref:TrbI/VirB10 family protein n=1 Tax=Asticcacaulis aquaticus TaxID=2984212 RepID=A0ABT5HWJ2_9CAUL|nr:TrbI/VirB10 family protein [Asticcacaulis aquaticus]MDC7684408.1 TrbI/VirB10 family protein [Asticcacaulis aquaticus]